MTILMDFFATAGRTLLDLCIRQWPLLPSGAFNGAQEDVDTYTFALARYKIEELQAHATTVSQCRGRLSRD